MSDKSEWVTTKSAPETAMYSQRNGCRSNVELHVISSPAQRKVRGRAKERTPPDLRPLRPCHDVAVSPPYPFLDELGGRTVT